MPYAKRVKVLHGGSVPEGALLKKILVSGTDGFIGPHLTEALVRAGRDERAFVLYKGISD